METNLPRLGDARRYPREFMKPSILILALVVLLVLSPSIGAGQSNDAVSFGDRQLQQVLDDRPLMKAYFSSKDSVWQWAIEKFNHGYQGDRVHWDHSEPIGADSEYILQQTPATGPCCVRLTRRAHVNGMDQWCMLVFELENISYGPKAAKRYQDAGSGAVPKDQFLKKIARIEFEVALKVKAKMKAWKGFGDSKSLSLRERQFINHPEDFDVYFGAIQNNPSGYLQHYAKWYDSVTAQRKPRDQPDQ